MIEPEGELGWSTLAIWIGTDWTRDGAKPLDMLKAFQISVGIVHCYSMGDVEFHWALLAHNGEV